MENCRSYALTVSEAGMLASTHVPVVLSNMRSSDVRLEWFLAARFRF